MWYLSLTGILTNIIINVCFFFRKYLESKIVNHHLIKPDDNQYHQVNKQ